MNASPAEPPACSHSDSRPLQLYVPAAVVVAPLETCETVAVGALVAAGGALLSLVLLWTGAACRAWYPLPCEPEMLDVVAGSSDAGSV
jgi:hypothetical protein